MLDGSHVHIIYRSQILPRDGPQQRRQQQQQQHK
jgi:hypothetical protein